MKRPFFHLAIIAFFFVFTFGVASNPAQSAGSPPIIAIPIVNGNQGVTFDVPVTVDTQGVGIRGYGVNLDFDATKIQINSVTDQGFLGTCPGGQVYQGTVSIDNVGGHMTGASAAYLGCSSKTVSTVAGSPANILKVNVTVLGGAANGKMNWIFAANSKLIDANAANLLPPTIVLTPKWVMIGPAPNLTLAISFTPLGSGQNFDTKVIVSNTGGSLSDPDTLTITLSNTNPPISATFAVSTLNVNTSQSFTIPNSKLAFGALSSTATASLQNFGVQKTSIYSPTSDQGQVHVDATFAAYLKIFPDVQISFPKLAVGFNSAPGNVNVRSNTNWEVDVYDNNSITAWHLTEYDGTQYKTLRLVQPVHVASAQHDVTEGTPSLLANGTPLTQQGDDGLNVPITLKQTLLYADPLLPGGETYHLVLTFLVYVTM